MATAGKVGRVLTQTSDDPVAFSDEVTTANATYTRYAITDSAKCYWDKDTVPAVKKNGTVIMSGYSVEYPGGVIVFDTALLATDVITVSGKYVTVEQLAGFFNWTLTVGTTTLEDTSYESVEWSSFVIGSKNFKVTAEKYWDSTGTLSDRIGSEVLVVLYADFGTAKTRFEGYVVIDSIDVGSSANELINEKMSFTGKDGVYFRQG